MEIQDLAKCVSRAGRTGLAGLAVASFVPLVYATGGPGGTGPACTKDVHETNSVEGSSEGCEDWSICDKSDVCADVPDGSFSNCGTASGPYTSCCQSYSGGTYDPITGLCEIDENTQMGSSQPSGETHTRFHDPVACP
jgi:hypothetical protein